MGIGGTPGEGGGTQRLGLLGDLAALGVGVGIRVFTMVVGGGLIAYGLLSERDWGVRAVAITWGLLALLWFGAKLFPRASGLERAAWVYAGLFLLCNGIVFFTVGVASLFMPNEIPGLVLPSSSWEAPSPPMGAPFSCAGGSAEIARQAYPRPQLEAFRVRKAPLRGLFRTRKAIWASLAGGVSQALLWGGGPERR
ncbi:MAG: hypothetical protein M3198_03065 [Actinomycetota bacterium]|nr:hypothetical protein [Actinomycetota bacterium]